MSFENKKVLVLEENNERFMNKLKKLEKIFNFQGLLFQCSKPVTKLIDLKYVHDNKTVVSKAVAYEYVIQYQPLTVNNQYQVVGCLEKNNERLIFTYLSDENKHLIDKKLMHDDLVCDHCSTKRKRKQVFLVKDTKTNTIMRLGNSCLQTYIPRTVSSVLTMLDYSDKFFSEDWGFHDTSMKLPVVYPFRKFISCCLANIEQSGFKDMGGLSDKSTWKQSVIDTYSKDFEHEKTLEAIQYFIGLEQMNSQTKINLTETFVPEDFIREEYLRRFAYFTSKFLKDRIEQPEKTSLSNYVGEVGEKVEFMNVRFKKSIFIDSHGFFIHLLETEDGNILSHLSRNFWLDICKTDLEEDDNYYTDEFAQSFNYSFIAKIKQHRVYQEEKQTVIFYIKKVKLEKIGV